MYRNPYLSWYELALKSLNYSVLGKARTKDFKKVVLTGMGGSGIICDAIYTVLFSNSEVPVSVVKGFQPPKWVDSETLVCGISYSGNTVETISVVLKSMELGAEVCAVASGGKLLEIARSKNLPHVIVDGGLLPRVAFPQLLIATIKILDVYGIKVCDNLGEIIDVLKERSIADYISKELADFLKESLPVIISNNEMYPLALRFKDELNENAKMIAKVEVIPEWAHNDIVGWELPINLEVLRALIIWSDDPIIEFASNYLREVGVKTYIFKLLGYGVLSKVLYGSLVAGLTTTYLAELRGIKADETKSIDEYKKFLSSIKGRFKVFY
ncbi:MAG: bifunctional phosphoglucose/phosphomannose isomerase [Sulfolobales archaeon]|nr:bifunctional phosphoglucose/phosphomannose isomerase [Sulfolobales archaeon]MCX8186096.1 bifunctional phosphoglucose/phosphomannose isomerase [Sulfolobales archaeon]MDW7969391.1 bifunctional phosphoglucose/phosphomannose isomerase [Sulfolobales archaeon]